MSSGDPKKPATRSLAVITDQAGSEFVAQAERGISRKAIAAGWRYRFIETGTLSYPGRLALLKQTIASGEFSAALYVHLLLDDEQAALFHAAKVPLGYLSGSLREVDCVATDDSEGAYQAARQLIDLGHKKLAILAPPADQPESFLRLEGFMRALDEAKLSLPQGAEISLPDYSAKSGAAAAEQLLKLREKPTAIFVAAGDVAAEGVMKGLQAKGLNIPRDISVLGYDDLPLAEALNPPLSSVRQPLEAMAARLTEVLIERVLRPSLRPALQQNFDPELVLRLSTGVPKR